MNLQRLHVESAAGELLSIGDKASFQDAVDGVATALEPGESVVWMVQSFRDTPGRGGKQCLLVVTTNRMVLLPKEEEDREAVQFHALHTELDINVVKRGRISTKVEAEHDDGAVALLSLSPAQLDTLLDVLDRVSRRDSTVLRPDARAYDPSAGPWWSQLSAGYGYEWQLTNYRVEARNLTRRDTPLRIDREGVRFGKESRPDLFLPWHEIHDIGTTGAKPGLFRKARGGGAGFAGAFAGGIDPSEAGQMAIFVVRTADLEAHVNVTTFSPTPLRRLLAVLDDFTAAHHEGRLPGPAAGSGPAGPAAPVTPVPPATVGTPPPSAEAPPPSAEVPPPTVVPLNPFTPAPLAGGLDLSTVVLPSGPVDHPAPPPVTPPPAGESHADQSSPAAATATTVDPASTADPASADAAMRLARIREQLQMLQALHADGLLSDAELAAKRASILDAL